ncbi:hypothetical protein [Pendulispora albinea]|uniref:Uncharacterized protein n=1 Tax=Pendulispora albinea TaxID=2741071 RepID=A0ABZ2LMM1_9BACT
MAEATVSPRECALAIGVPLTERSFLDDLGRANADFARHVLAETGLSASTFWARLYELRVVRPARAVIERVSRLGVTVVPSATLADLALLFQRFRVVTLFTHCRSPGIVPEDIEDPAACIRALATNESLVARHLRARLADTPPTRAALARALEEAMLPARAVYEALAGTAASGAGQPPALLVDRLMIELECGSAIRPASYIELRDGVATFRAFLATIPPVFDGVVDLSTCNSAMLAEPLKRRRPSCLAIANRHPATPAFRLARYALVQRLLSMQPQRFTDAVMRVHQLVMEDGR